MCMTVSACHERVQLPNVHGAVACACVPTWSRCMCMTVSACHQNVTESTRTRSYDTKNTPVHFTATVNRLVRRSRRALCLCCRHRRATFSFSQCRCQISVMTGHSELRVTERRPVKLPSSGNS